MKLLIASALFVSQGIWAGELQVKQLSCSAVNTLGYASLQLENENEVRIIVNNLFSSQAKIKSVEDRAINLEQAIPSREYRIEFKELLKPGVQDAAGIFYSKISSHSPLVPTSFVNCKINLN